MNEKKCPLCDKKIYSEIENGCRMCGMMLNLNENFCSTNCERTYLNIRKIKFI